MKKSFALSPPRRAIEKLEVFLEFWARRAGPKKQQKNGVWPRFEHFLACRKISEFSRAEKKIFADFRDFRGFCRSEKRAQIGELFTKCTKNARRNFPEFRVFLVFFSCKIGRFFDKFGMLKRANFSLNARFFSGAKKVCFFVFFRRSSRPKNLWFLKNIFRETLGVTVFFSRALEKKSKFFKKFLRVFLWLFRAFFQHFCLAEP